jgi:hypothetical protein
MNEQDGWWARLKYAYWWTVPYEWRPGQLWYALKCRLWKRYSTVKPRWLGNTWVDRDTLLVHLMFEVLGQYLEREAGPPTPAETSPCEYADAWADTRRELRELWRWWTEEYLTADERLEEKYLKGIESPKLRGVDVPEVPPEEQVGLRASIFQFSSDEAHMRWAEATTGKAYAEMKLEDELTTRLKRLVELRKGLWT